MLAIGENCPRTVPGVDKSDRLHTAGHDAWDSMDQAGRLG